MVDPKTHRHDPTYIEFYEKHYYRKESKDVIVASHLSVLCLMIVVGIGISTCSSLPIKTAQDIIDNSYEYENKIIAKQQDYEAKVMARNDLTPHQKNDIIKHSRQQTLDEVNHSRQVSMDVEKLGKEAKAIQVQNDKLSEDAEFGWWMKRILIGAGAVIAFIGLFILYKKFF